MSTSSGMSTTFTYAVFKDWRSKVCRFSFTVNESDIFVAIYFTRKSNLSEYKQDDHVISTIQNAVIF